MRFFVFGFCRSVLRLQNCRYRRRTNGSSCCLAGIDIRQLQDCIGRDLYPFRPPRKLRTQQVSGSYFVIRGDKLRAYLTREVDGSKLFSGISPLNGGEADLQIGEPEVRHNGDVNISLRVQGNQHYRVFEWVMTLYHDSNQCSVQANKVYMAGNYSFKGRILPLPEK